METIVVAASRSSTFGLSEMQMIVGSAVVVCVLAWMVLMRMRHDRHEPHA